MRSECDKVIDYFNDQLNIREKEEFEKHLETCAECREEIEELRLLTEDLPFASEPVDPPKDMKDRVLGAVLSEESSSNEENTEEDSSMQQGENDSQAVDFDQKREQLKKEEKSSRSSPIWLLRGLAAALVLSIAGNLFALMNQEASQEPDPTDTPTDESGTDQVMKRVQLHGESTDAIASAALVKQQQGDILTLQAEQLEQLEGNDVYQVWLIQGKTPYRAGTFVANENGEGAVSYSLNNLPEDTNWDAVAISKEPDATSKKPQGKIILKSEL